MRWFRDKIRQGSWAALVALAVNLALSFGHVHAIDGKGLGARAGALVAALAAPDTNQKPIHHDDGDVDYLCPICMASAVMASGLAPSPPVVPLDFAVSSVECAIEPVLAVVEPLPAGFQSRGPPIS